MQAQEDSLAQTEEQAGLTAITLTGILTGAIVLLCAARQEEFMQENLVLENTMKWALPL